MKTANDGLRFLLELSTLVALAWAGWQLPDHIATQVLVAVGAPLAVALIWARWIAPRSSTRVDDPLRLALEVAVFGSPVVALVAVQRQSWASVFAAIAALHLGLTFALNQR